MVGGYVVQIYIPKDGSGKQWLNLCDGNNDYCSVMVGEEHHIKLKDKMWWQGGVCYWTRAPEFVEKKIEKLSVSGVPHPLGKEFEIKTDMLPAFRSLKERFKQLEETIKDPTIKRMMELFEDRREADNKAIALFGVLKNIFKAHGSKFSGGEQKTISTVLDYTKMYDKEQGTCPVVQSHQLELSQ